MNLILNYLIFKSRTQVIWNIFFTTIFLCIIFSLSIISLKESGMIPILILLALIVIAFPQYEFNYRLFNEVPKKIILSDGLLTAEMLFGKVIRMDLKKINEINKIKSYLFNNEFSIYVSADLGKRKIRISRYLTGYETLIRQILETNPNCRVDGELYNSMYLSNFYDYKKSITEEEIQIKIIAYIVFVIIIVGGWILMPIQYSTIFVSIVLVYLLWTSCRELYFTVKYFAKTIQIEGNVLSAKLFFGKELSLNIDNIDLIEERKSFGQQKQIYIVSSREKKQIQIQREIKNYGQLLKQILEKNINCRIEKDLLI